MSDKKIIAVVGATGAQGGGLVRAIVADSSGPFVARAITRNPGSDKAKELAALGVQVVTGDADDEKSMEQAFRGAYGAFCVTNFWEHMSPEREIAQATAMAKAAKTAGIQHAIWSTLEDSRKYIPLHDDRMPTLHGKWKVPHFDAKSVGDESFREAGVPTTFLLTSFYWDNLIYFGMGPRRARMARSVSCCRWVSGSCQASRPATSAQRRTRSSRRARSTSARRSAYRANT